MSQQQQSSQPRGHAPVEPEQCLILRLPPSTADRLRADIESGAQLQDRLSLEARQDLRCFTLSYGGETLPGRLVDLPCIVEAHKTADARTFYKVANITQMLMCGDDAVASESPSALRRRRRSPSASATVSATAEERVHQWDHGLTPPLKNVRKRRFRRVLRNRSLDMPELEKEVKRLLRNDADASDVKWEVLTEEEAAKLDSVASQQQQQQQQQDSSTGARVDNEGNNLMTTTQLFGDISDSSSSDSGSDDSGDGHGGGDVGEVPEPDSDKDDEDDMMEEPEDLANND